MSATITLPLTEWNTLIADKQALANEIAELRKLLDEARLDGVARPGNSNGKKLDALVRNAIDVVRYAVSNLPPECTPGWPVEALRTVAENIEALPTYDNIDRDLRVELLAFVEQAEENEDRRRRKSKT